MPSRVPIRLQRPAWFIVGLFAGLIVLGAAYMLGMYALEGKPRSFLESLSWAAETLTTTGYGRDNQWHHPAMIIFVILVQFLGLSLVFLVFPLFVLPFFESRFEERLPRRIPLGLSDFVLIYRYGPAVSTLIKDLEEQKIESVVLEEDESLARRLRDRGLRVVLMSLDDENPLGTEGVTARAMIVNGTDHDNAVMVLSARQSGYTGPIYALVENPKHRGPIVLAGATAAYSPKHALAAALAAQASHRISPRVAGLQQLGEHLQVAEMRIGRESDLAGKRVAEAGIRDRTGATVVAMWIGGVFVSEVDAGTVLPPGGILVVLGSAASLERLSELTTPVFRGGPFVIAGCGEVGGRVGEMLRSVGEQAVTLDVAPDKGADVVADALDADALSRAGVHEARAVILALASDSTNLFGASIVRGMVPDVPIIARVNQTEDVNRIRAAGADFALSISQVAGQLLGRRILGEEYVALEPRMRVAKARVGSLEGLAVRNARIREHTGCSLVAVERDDGLLTELDGDLTLRSGDIVYLVGSNEAVGRYFSRYPNARTETGSGTSVEE